MVSATAGKPPQDLREIEKALMSLIFVRYPSENGTREKVAKLLRQFFIFLDAEGCEVLDDIQEVNLEDFYWWSVRRGGIVEPSAATAANRQWAVRVFFEVLRGIGMWSGPDLTGESIKREGGESARPASDEQIQRLKSISANVITPNGDEILVALALSGGNPGEIAQVRVSDLDLVSGHVHFRGDSERINQLDAWAQEVLEVVVLRATSAGPLAVRPDLPLAKASHSVTVRLNRIILHAGLSRKAGLTGASIRLGAAKAVLDREGLEAAARFLGNNSLDLTARALGYRWWGMG